MIERRHSAEGQLVSRKLKPLVFPEEPFIDKQCYEAVPAMSIDSSHVKTQRNSISKLTKVVSPTGLFHTNCLNL